MATTAFSRLFAATAAVLIGLSGCGGGGDESSVASVKSVAEALNGPAVDFGTTFDGRPRMQALSVPVSESVAAIKPVIDFRFTVNNSGAPAQALAISASAAEAADTITWDQLADYVERTYPSLFPGHQTSQPLESEGVNYVVRYYPVLPDGRGNYIGMTPDGRVYGYGQFTNYVLTQYGDLSTWTGPRLVSAKIVSDDGQSVDAGAGEVSAKGTKLVLGYDKALGCAGVGGTGKVGAIIATISCDATAKTVTFVPGLPGEQRWPFGAKNTVTVGGLVGQDGLPSPQATASFTTRPVAVSASVYVGNGSPGPVGAQSAAAINLQSGAVTQVNLDGSRQGFGGARRVVVDPLTGTVWYGMLGTVALYRTDMETSRELPPVLLDLERTHALQGLALTEDDLCAVFGQTNSLPYSRQNQLECRNRTTLQVAFTSPAGYLADANTMMTIGMRYLPFGAEKKLYALSADKTSHFGEVWDGNGAIREGYLPGTRGEVTEIDATTYQVTNRFQVGSVPQGIDRDSATGDLYVVNSGDRSLSVIDRNGRVTTVSLAAAFTGMQRPMRIKIDQSRKKFYVTDYLGSVVVFDLATRREVNRLPTGVLPIDLAMSADSLYVVSMDGKVTEITLDTPTVRRTFSGLGWNSYAIDLYTK